MAVSEVVRVGMADGQAVRDAGYVRAAIPQGQVMEAARLSAQLWGQRKDAIPPLFEAQ